MTGSKGVAPKPDDDIARLRLAVVRLSRLLRQHSPTGLSPTQQSALATIRRSGVLSIGNLASIEQITAPTASTVASRLEERGLIVRHADPDDGRVVMLSLTESGERLLAESLERRNRWLGGRLADLQPDVRSRVSAAIDGLEALAAAEIIGLDEQCEPPPIERRGD